MTRSRLFLHLPEFPPPGSMPRGLAKTLIACVATGSALCPNLSVAEFPSDGNSRGGTVHWPRKDFVIPFQVDPSGESPTEVRLEVSENQGQTWTLYTRGDVRTRQFQFHAQRDGEFRFRLKTVDRNGNVFDNPGDPLSVIVDTIKPTGELVVDIDPKGTMLAEFRLVDLALEPQSIRMEYQTDASNQWTEVACELSQGSEAGEWIGFGRWTMPQSTSQLMVRVTARDQAGNPTELMRMPRLPRSASLGHEMTLASIKGLQDPTGPIGSGIARRPAPPSILQSDESSIPKVEILGGPGSRRPMVEMDRESFSRQQVLESQEKLIEYQNRLLMQQRAVSGFGFPDPTATKSLLPTRPLDDTPRDVGPNASLTSIANSIPPATNATLGSSPMPQDIVNLPSQPREGVGRIDAAARTLYSNSKIFSLDYAIENDPGASISNVELWGTVDRGAVWEKWGTDEDRQSPFDIQVETEGLFGFRMVIVGANGLASRRPLPGDDADAWIQVDTSVPQAKILSALNGKGPDAGSLVIEYLAIDDYFSERPISFFYAESPAGPWLPITQGARNNSRYVWTADPSMPPTVYLRLEAVDAAGNIGSHQLDLPVDVQGAAPRGRIQGFRPQR